MGAILIYPKKSEKSDMDEEKPVSRTQMKKQKREERKQRIMTK